MGNILLSTSTTNIMNGLDYAWNDGEAVLWVIAYKYIAPLILLVLAIYILFVLCKTGVSLNKMHSQWEENAFQLITLIAIMAVVGGFWGWGAKMLGKSPSSPTADISITEYVVQEGAQPVWTQLKL